MADDATVGSIAWSDVNNAKTSNNAYATGGTSAEIFSTLYYLKATNLGFSIPTGATIDGILVEIEKKKYGRNVLDTEVKIVKANGTIGTTNKGDLVTEWAETDTYKSYGSSSDLWGETWTAENINDVDFGVVLSAKIRSESQDSAIAYVDHIRITVYYTASANCDGSGACYLRTLGESCSGDGECSSGHCIDGVCCDTACSGSTCQRCDSYSNAGAGTCGYISTVVDPDNECAQGSTCSDGCRSNNCSGAAYSCGVQSTGDGGCPACGKCTGASEVCTDYGHGFADQTAPGYCACGYPGNQPHCAGACGAGCDISPLCPPP
jgi:hypothetical protein